jgi:hypothetical protein
MHERVNGRWQPQGELHKRGAGRKEGASPQMGSKVLTSSEKHEVLCTSTCPQVHKQSKRDEGEDKKKFPEKGKTKRSNKEYQGEIQNKEG